MSNPIHSTVVQQDEATNNFIQRIFPHVEERSLNSLTQVLINKVDNYECRILHEIFIARYKKILKIVTASFECSEMFFQIVFINEIYAKIALPTKI